MSREKLIVRDSPSNESINTEFVNVFPEAQEATYSTVSSGPSTSTDQQHPIAEPKRIKQLRAASSPSKKTQRFSDGSTNSTDSSSSALLPGSPNLMNQLVRAATPKLVQVLPSTERSLDQNVHFDLVNEVHGKGAINENSVSVVPAKRVDFKSPDIQTAWANLDEMEEEKRVEHSITGPGSSEKNTSSSAYGVENENVASSRRSSTGSSVEMNRNPTTLSLQDVGGTRMEPVDQLDRREDAEEMNTSDKDHPDKKEEKPVEKVAEIVDELSKKVVSDTDSFIKTAIPNLPLGLATFCFLCNTFIPGTGTILSGFATVCCGEIRINTKDSRLTATLCTNMAVGIAQFFTVPFMLVGWFWSFVWGIYLIILAVETRKKKKERRIREIQARTLAAMSSRVRQWTLKV